MIKTVFGKRSGECQKIIHTLLNQEFPFPRSFFARA
jgi:hypothetical protein